MLKNMQVPAFHGLSTLPSTSGYISPRGLDFFGTGELGWEAGGCEKPPAPAPLGKMYFGLDFSHTFLCFSQDLFCDTG